MKAYKLFRLKKNGDITPIFINKTQVIKQGVWYRAECHPTKGYKVRPGWHCTSLPLAPHLTTKGRVWCEVEILDITPLERPQSQGGLWFLARLMMVIRYV